MPDRLDELRRQRALLHQHIAWLDRQIEEAEHTDRPLDLTSASPRPHVPTAPDASRSVAGAVAPTNSAPLPAGSPPGASLGSSTEPDFTPYVIPAATLQSDVRKGCFLYFAAALVGLGFLIALLYFALSAK